MSMFVFGSNQQEIECGDDPYIPTDDEAAEALADAEKMNENMRKYGTIDAPKGDGK